MNNSTRITRNEVVDLCETIHAANPDLPAFGARVLGLFLCVRLTLTYLRHNLPQGLVAEVYSVSQATASRVITPTHWGAWCFSDWGSFSSRESIGWRPCQQRDTQTSSRPRWCVR